MREKGRAAIYLMAAFYLFSLAYRMFGARMEHGGEDYTLMMVFSVVFAIFGIALIVFSVVLFKRCSADGRETRKDDVLKQEDQSKNGGQS